MRRYAILEASENTCNSTMSLDDVHLYHLGISMVSNIFMVVFHFCHLFNISSGMGSSQSIFFFQRSCIIHFGSINAGVRMPNGSKIELTKLNIPRFVSGTSLLTVLIRNTSCFGSHNIPNVRSIGVWSKSKLTKFFDDGGCSVVHFKTSELFETNLVYLNPPDFSNCITSPITLVACSNEGKESR